MTIIVQLAFVTRIMQLNGRPLNFLTKFLIFLKKKNCSFFCVAGSGSQSSCCNIVFKTPIYRWANCPSDSSKGKGCGDLQVAEVIWPASPRAPQWHLLMWRWWTTQSEQRWGTTCGSKPTAPSVQHGPHEHGDGSAGALGTAGCQVVTSHSPAVSMTGPSQVRLLSLEFVPLCTLA
jgi:hypothetical protein